MKNEKELLSEVEIDVMMNMAAYRAAKALLYAFVGMQVTGMVLAFGGLLFIGYDNHLFRNMVICGMSTWVSGGLMFHYGKRHVAQVLKRHKRWYNLNKKL